MIKLSTSSSCKLNLQGSILGVLLLAFTPIRSSAQVPAGESGPCKTMVIGFVGGMRSPEDLSQGVVQIGNRLRGLDQNGLEVNIYSHWHWRKAFELIRERIDQNLDNSLSKKEIEQAPKIIIYGHSLGGWAAIKLTRRLNQARIRVELAVQLDTVGPGDAVVPSNVKFAANFYQRTMWPLRGEKKIRAEDERRTKIVGNFLVPETGHEALARKAEISDFITETISQLCPSAPRTPNN